MLRLFSRRIVGPYHVVSDQMVGAKACGYLPRFNIILSVEVVGARSNIDQLVADRQSSDCIEEGRTWLCLAPALWLTWF